MASLLENLAKPFDTSTSYNIDNKFVYEGHMYKVVEPFTGDFDADKVIEVTLADLLQTGSVSDDDIPFIAPIYDDTQSYKVGDIVEYNKKMYQCISDTNGLFDADAWEKIYLSNLDNSSKDDNTVIVEALQTKIPDEFDELSTSANNAQIADAILNSNLGDIVSMLSNLSETSSGYGKVFSITAAKEHKKALIIVLAQRDGNVSPNGTFCSSPYIKNTIMEKLYSGQNSITKLGIYYVENMPSNKSLTIRWDGSNNIVCAMYIFEIE